jgi:hypothetical protein
VGRYREPNVLPDGRIITSWADGPVNDMNEQSLTPPDFGIYVYDPASGKNELVYNDRSTWDLNAVPVVERREPPPIASAQHAADSTIPVLMGSIDITQTSLLDETVSGAQMNNLGLHDALKQAIAVRVIEGFSSEAAKGVSMFGLTMFEGAAVLGEAPIYNDGSWLASVPAYIPIHLQPIDQFGLSIRNQQLWIQGMPGEERRCDGCHESRTGTGIAVAPGQTAAEQATMGKGEQYIEPIAQRVEFPWQKVQAVIDANGCSGCHNSSTTAYYFMTRTDPVTGLSTTYKVPSLDLTSTPVTVYYDRKVATYPASYVSIFYPSTMGMMGDGMGKITYSGAAPCQGQGLNGGGTGPAVLNQNGTIGAGCTPWWGIPGSARASALTEVVNLHGADGTSTAWPVGTHPFHPENVNKTMSDADRKTLAVYPMDLGGQYWARQNTGFVPYISGDPVNPKHVAQ